MNFLGMMCVDLYQQQYPDDDCGFMEPDDYINIESGGRCVEQPEEETIESFIDRLERSKKAGRNLFLEEWPEAKDDDPDAWR